MRKYRSITVFSLLLISSAHFLFAEENVETVHVIEEINYIIDGSTREKALRELSDIEPGMEFPSKVEMILEIETEKHDLINYRVFESVSYEYELLRSETNIKRYSVSFYIEDAFTIVPIPYPNYDSNTGLRLGVKTYWDNFLGTMTDAYLGFGVDIRRNDTTGKVETGEWNIGTSVSRIRLTDTLFLRVGLGFSYNEEDFIDTVVPSNSYDYSYYTAGFNFGTTFDLKNDFYYGLNLGGTFRYGYEGNLGPNFQQPYAFTPSHSIGYSRVNWIENLRDGFATGISNSYRIGSGEEFFFISSIDASARYYFPFWKRFYFYTQLKGFYQWGEIRSRVGSYIRGVQNNLMSGYTGAFLNTSLAFQFWRFENVWDAQVHPFIDIGIVYNNESFDSYRDFNVGIGADFVLYLDALPSLVAVGSIGIDPKRFDPNDISGSLEISISSTLFY